MSDDKVKPIKRTLFSAGEITISPEAYQCIKDAGSTPSDLINRHTQGDWEDGPGKWIARNHEVVAGRDDGPIMSVYRLHPGETRICVGTESDKSATTLTVWPQPDGHRKPVPITTAERISQETKPLAQPAVGRTVKDIFDSWGKNRAVSQTQPVGKGPTRYGPDR